MRFAKWGFGVPAVLLVLFFPFLIVMGSFDSDDGSVVGGSGGSGEVISLARSRIGLPYVYGGTDWDTGMDCSGFTSQVLKRVGVDIPRTAFAQFQAGKKIGRDEAVAGDLIYWGSGGGGMYEHVGIYIGNGMMIHSGSGGVQEIPVIEHLHGTGPQFFRVADFAGSSGGGSANSPEGAKAYARSLMGAYGWGEGEYQCLVQLWEHESGWRYNADNPGSDAYGIPQAMTNMYDLPEGYMTDGAVQVRWGLGYIQGRYKTPCRAWEFWQNPTSGNPSWGNWY